MESKVMKTQIVEAKVSEIRKKHSKGLNTNIWEVDIKDETFLATLTINVDKDLGCDLKKGDKGYKVIHENFMVAFSRGAKIYELWNI